MKKNTEVAQPLLKGNKKHIKPLSAIRIPIPRPGGPHGGKKKFKRRGKHKGKSDE